MYLKSLTLKRVQVLRVRDDPAARARHHVHRRPQRLRQVQRRRRAGLGDGRAGRQVPARRQDGGRHLRRHVRAARRWAAPRSLLTIDNADGALPIEYSEVTISRTMFRNGGSEYAINGTPCRLLDVQELLCDSGIGREMHVIVGQGQLDSILHATPEDRRGLHRGGGRRPQAPQAQGEGAPQARLHRRQPDPAPGPAQRDPPPAQAARAAGRGGPRAAVVQADARDARARLLADDLVTARTALEQELADETILLRAPRGGRGRRRAGP